MYFQRTFFISAGILASILSNTSVGQIRFNDQIRPILSDKCFFCHGPDAAKREADLRLDSYDEAIGFGAIVPGDPDKSEILERMLSDEPDVQMPPPSSKLARPTKEEIEILRQWIKEGAKYEKHWSFESLDFQKLSPVANSNPIDPVIRNYLTSRGLSQQPRADKSTLARRAAFDVTGLPPSPQRVREFIADDSPKAWENYIDSLLASKQYGERMAADWLDIARYADSYGFQVDRERTVWQWRDWVVNSFNENKPFDKFIVEQLAGDLLPTPTKDQILATAFNRLHQQESEGGSVEEEYRVEYVADRVQTYATAFLGLTFECARCHDHKFDPIKQSEYYQLFAIFHNIDEAGLYSFFTDSPPTPAFGLTDNTTDQKIAEQLRTVQELESGLAEAIVRETPMAYSWFESLRNQFSASMANPQSDDQQAVAILRKALRPREPILDISFDSLEGKSLTNSASPDAPAKLEGENKLVPGKRGSAVLFTGDDAVKTTQGNFGRHEPFSISLWIHVPDSKERAVVFHRSRAWTDAASRGYELLIEDGKLKWSLIHFWPGNAISIKTKSDLPLNQWIHVTATYDGSSRADGLSIYLQGNRSDCEVIRDGLTKQITGGGYDFIDLGERFRDRGFKGGLIDDFQVYADCLTAWEVQNLFGTDWYAHLLGTKSASDLTKDLLVEHYIHKKSERIQKRKASLREERRKLYELQDKVHEIMVMRELPTKKPAYVLTRGEYNLRADQVEPGTPAVLSPFPDDLPRNRLGLARWTVAKDHPLTARVTVNRVWQSIFGRGLVKTSEDFGSQGARPLYPQVLDALAVRFIESGWNMKDLVKTILMSDTYQQRSVSDRANMEDDPENELLARGPRFRLPAEMIRDNVLAASGLLDLASGGPPVNPYEMSESFKPAKWSEGSGVYRRSLYTNWRRTGPPPALLAFDAPRRAVCTAKRERTDSPLQALVLLNGVQYVEAARALADRLIRENPDDSALIENAFWICLSRAPDNRERSIVNRLLADQKKEFEASDDRTKEFLQIGRFAANPDIPLPQLASVTVLCQVLMNHDSCVVKR
jgi:hypothetical protein